MKPTPDLSFYSTAAQIIPLFVIVIAFEARRTLYPQFVEPGPVFPPGLRRLIRLLNISNHITSIGALVVCVIGEIIALHVLASGKPTANTKGEVELALFLSGLLLVANLIADLYVNPLMEKTNKRVEERYRQAIKQRLDELPDE